MKRSYLEASANRSMDHASFTIKMEKFVRASATRVERLRWSIVTLSRVLVMVVGARRDTIGGTAAGVQARRKKAQEIAAPPFVTADCA